jgi:hypothetical protein
MRLQRPDASDDLRRERMDDAGVERFGAAHDGEHLLLDVERF